MKNNNKLLRFIPVFIIISFVCITCEYQLHNKEYPYIPEYENYIKKEIWNGFEFRQHKYVTNNQYDITLNKFKTVFNSASFTDEEREQIKSNINFIVIFGISWNNKGGITGRYGTGDSYFVYIYSNSILDEIVEGLKNILNWQGE